MKQNLLKRQLEITRFERAIEATEGLADHRALLTTSELARLNRILTGKADDPWRQDTVTLTLPSGKIETLALIADPQNTAREKLHRATERAEGGLVLDAAIDLYLELILAHVFKDANRRTAALGSHYILRRYGSPITGIMLHELGVGDLRQPGQTEAFREIAHQIAKFVEKRSQT